MMPHGITGLERVNRRHILDIKSSLWEVVALSEGWWDTWLIHLPLWSVYFFISKMINSLAEMKIQVLLSMKLCPLFWRSLMLPCLGFWIACTKRMEAASFSEASITVYQFDVVSYPRRCEFSSTPLWEPHFSSGKDQYVNKITVLVELCKPNIFIGVFVVI
jgi:hypothetical protein